MEGYVHQLWTSRRILPGVALIMVSSFLLKYFGIFRSPPTPVIRLQDCTSNRKMTPFMTKHIANLKSQYIVPNIAHYNWFTDKPKKLRFHELLSLLSVQKFMKAEKIFFHHNMEPTGPYWEEAKKQIPNLVLVHRDPPQCVFGKLLKHPHYETSNSDANRVLLMQEYGGVFLDLDVLIIKSLDPLRVYQTTLGLEWPERVCGGFIMSAPHSPFLYLWINTMLEDYQVNKWAYISGVIPTRLYERYKDTGIVHLEADTLHKPNCFQLQYLIGPQKYNWRESYTVHLWYRLWHEHKNWTTWKITPDPESIKTHNSTFGQIARLIYYGSPETIN